MSALVPDERFAKLASDEDVERTAAALKSKGYNVQVVNTGAEAKAAVEAILPRGAKVFPNTSITLQQIGLEAEFQTDKYVNVKTSTYKMDRATQGDEIRRIHASPDWVVGSAHAVTVDGALYWASLTGSQLGGITGGAGKVVLVIGTQKIVPNDDVAEKRIESYCYPLEDARARAAYGAPSGVNHVLKMKHPNPYAPGRISIILVKEKLGF